MEKDAWKNYYREKRAKELRELERERWRGKITTFLGVALVTMMLAAPIGYMSFKAIGHMIAQTPYGVRYTADPALYHPYDTRETVPAEVDSIEQGVLDSKAPIYGIGFGMLIALILSFLMLFEEHKWEKDTEMSVLALIPVSSFFVSFFCSFAAMVVMAPFFQEGINANWLQPVVIQWFLAMLFCAVSIGVGFAYVIAKDVFWGIIEKCQIGLADYRQALSDYLDE